MCFNGLFYLVDLSATLSDLYFTLGYGYTSELTLEFEILSLLPLVSLDVIGCRVIWLSCRSQSP